MTVLVIPADDMTPIRAPVNAEQASAEDLLNNVIQPIANQLEWTRQRIPGVQDSREITLSVKGIARGDSWSESVDYKPFMLAQNASVAQSLDYALWIPIHDAIPTGCRISSFGVRVMANASHPSSLPESMPRLILGEVAKLGGATTGLNNFVDVYDTSTTVADYKLMHSIHLSLPGGGWTSTFQVNTLSNEYYLILRNEYGNNSTNGLRVYSAWINVVPV